MDGSSLKKVGGGGQAKLRPDDAMFLKRPTTSPRRSKGILGRPQLASRPAGLAANAFHVLCLKFMKPLITK